MAHEFSSVTLEAEHVPETHFTNGEARGGPTEELPGMVNIYLVFDGARLLFTQYKAGKVFDAIDLAAQNQSDEQDA